MRAAALALAFASCAPPADTAPAGAAAVANVFVSEGPVVRPLANGARLPLETGGWATLSFTPFPPAAGTEIEVALEGVDAADVFVTCEMVGMDHGAARRHAHASGARYRAPLELNMRGSYRVTIEVETASARSTVTLVVAGG